MSLLTTLEFLKRVAGDFATMEAKLESMGPFHRQNNGDDDRGDAEKDNNDDEKQSNTSDRPTGPLNPLNDDERVADMTSLGILTTKIRDLQL